MVLSLVMDMFPGKTISEWDASTQVFAACPQDLPDGPLTTYIDDVKVFFVDL